MLSSSALCARPIGADACLHWQLPLQRGWVMAAAAAAIAAAAAVVLVFSVDFDRGFGMGFGRRRDSRPLDVSADGQQRRCAISPFGLDSDASVSLHCPRRFSRVGSTMCGELRAAAVL